MPVDKFGVTMIYPNMTGDNVPKPWFIHDDFDDDPRCRHEENSSGNSTDGYHFDDNSKVRFTVSADSKDVDIECDNDFDKSTIRGYVYKANDWMGRSNSGVEMTAFYKMSDSGPKDNPIIMKGPTGEHHSNTDCCSGSAHMVHIGGVDEDIEDDLAMRFSKEMWHVHYITRSDYKPIPGETWSISDNKWFGVKYIIYKKTVSGNKTIQIDVYLSPDGNKTEWKKVLSTNDGGGWGDGGDDCNGDKDDILNFGNSRMMWRWDYRDGSDIKFKWNSIRQIDPNATFDNPEDPETPDTNEPTVTTFRTSLKLQRDINAFESPCGPGGLNIFYEIPATSNLIERNMTNNAAQTYRTIVGQKANPAGGSGMQGQTPKDVYFMLAKIGTPPSTCRAKIWNASGVEKYQSVNTVTFTALPTSFGTMTNFDFSTNTYQMQAGDSKHSPNDGNFNQAWFPLFD